MNKIDYEEESDKRLNWMDLTGGTAKDGMTLLDYFAGKALELIVEDDPNLAWEPGAMAYAAYQMAEAMLAERNKRFTPQNVVRGITGKTYG